MKKPNKYNQSKFVILELLTIITFVAVGVGIFVATAQGISDHVHAQEVSVNEQR